MGSKKKAAEGSFEKLFQDRLDTIVERGRAVGLTLTHICREAGTARATPDRWRAKSPLTITLVDKMEKVVADAERGAK